MKTIERAHAILASAPKDAAADVIGLTAIAVLIFAGFSVPAFI